MLQKSKHTLDQLIQDGRKHWALLVLLAIYLSVTLIYGQLFPLGEAPDEVAHMDLVRFIGQEGHLPRNPAERQAAGYKSAWPMLYHAMVGVATGWVDYDALPRLKMNDASPRRLLIEDSFPPFALIHTDDEMSPYQGIVLAWHLARLASALISAGIVIIAYVTVLTICPGERWLALGAAAVTAAIPQFHFIASAANDDSLLGLLGAAFTLSLVHVWQQPQRRWSYAWLGLWLGLALTTKYSVGLLPLLVIVVLLSAVRGRTLGWRAAAGRFLLFLGVLSLAAAWWFVYIEWFFNEVRQLGLLAGLIKPLMSTGGSDPSTQLVASALTGGLIQAPELVLNRATLWDWAIHLFRSFWFVPGEANANVVTLLSLLFLGLSGLAIAGLWRAWRSADQVPRPVLALLALQIGLLVPFPLLRFYLILRPAETGQGRHILFPAATAIGMLLTVGVSAWFPSTYRRRVGLGLAGILLAISLVSFFGYILPAFPPRLPVRTSPHAAQDVANPVNLTFNHEIELVGYQTSTLTPYGALPVTLIWRSLAYTDQDYLVELVLLDEQDRIRSLWLGHPADGHYPTRAWEPGDVINDTVWLPVTNLEAGDYRLRLRLQLSPDFTPGAPGATGRPSADTGEVFLTDVKLPSVPTPPSAARVSLGGPYSWIVWQAGQPTSGTPKYRYRAAIPITLVQVPSPEQSPPVGQPSAPGQVSLIGPDGASHTPLAQGGDTYIFLVDAFWPSGDYALQVKTPDGAVESGPILRAQVRQRSFAVPPMSTEIRANFGDEIMLLGYDFSERRVQPGGALPITLYWQALRPMSRHYVVSNHLLNSANLLQWGGRDRVPRDFYSTALWTPGEVVQDEYWVPVDPAAPPGVYRLDIGLYVAILGQSWYLPLVADGETLDTNDVTIAPIKVGGPPPGATIANPAPQHPQVANLADQVTLLGYDMRLEPETLRLTLYWRVDARLPADYTTFVHVRDATGQVTGQPGTIVAQMDRPPADGAYPTSLWDPGEVIRDTVLVPVPPHIPAGDYEIIAGLYNLATGQRLPILNGQRQSRKAGRQPAGDYIRLQQQISVP